MDVENRWQLDDSGYNNIVLALHKVRLPSFTKNNIKNRSFIGFNFLINGIFIHEEAKKRLRVRVNADQMMMKFL